jgi:hypothetical protein
MFENKHIPTNKTTCSRTVSIAEGKIHDGNGEEGGSAGDQIAKITGSGMNRNRK